MKPFQNVTTAQPYQLACIEDQTGYIFTHRGHYLDDDSAVTFCEMAFQDAQEVRREAGGFELTLMYLHCLEIPQRLVKDWRAVNSPLTPG